MPARLRQACNERDGATMLGAIPPTVPAGHVSAGVEAGHTGCKSAYVK